MVLKAGVPFGSVDAVIAGTGNKVFQRGLTTVKEQMTGGEGFAGPLIRTRLFPPMMTQMVRVGEETGRSTPISNRLPTFTKRSSSTASAR